MEVNFNGELNEAPESVYRITYPTVARRIIDNKVRLRVGAPGVKTLTIKPLDPGMMLEKIVIDLGGYQESYLYGKESPCQRTQGTIY